MEKCIVWLFDFALWLAMRVVYVTEPYKVAFTKAPAVQEPHVRLEIPPGNEDLAVATSFAKEYLDDQVQSTGVIQEKFKAIMAMYSFSVPILIGFLSSRIVLLPHLVLAALGILVCIPGFCMMKYFSVNGYISATLSQDDICKSTRQQQIDQINWYYTKGTAINTGNNHNVNIYYATQRWLGLALITLLAMAFWLKFPPVPQPPAPAGNTFNNFALVNKKPAATGKEAEKPNHTAPRPK